MNTSPCISGCLKTQCQVGGMRFQSTKQACTRSILWSGMDEAHYKVVIRGWGIGAPWPWCRQRGRHLEVEAEVSLRAVQSTTACRVLVVIAPHIMLSLLAGVQYSYGP